MHAHNLLDQDDLNLNSILQWMHLKTQEINKFKREIQETQDFIELAPNDIEREGFLEELQDLAEKSMSYTSDVETELESKISNLANLSSLINVKIEQFKLVISEIFQLSANILYSFAINNQIPVDNGFDVDLVEPIIETEIPIANNSEHEDRRLQQLFLYFSAPKLTRNNEEKNSEEANFFTIYGYE